MPNNKENNWILFHWI